MVILNLTHMDVNSLKTSLLILFVKLVTDAIPCSISKVSKSLKL